MKIRLANAKRNSIMANRNFILITTAKGKEILYRRKILCKPTEFLSLIIK